jgi:hypothetical protein
LFDYERWFFQDQLESGFQCFSNKEINKLEHTDLTNVLKEFENINEENLEEWLQSDKRESVFQ